MGFAQRRSQRDPALRQGQLEKTTSSDTVKISTLPPPGWQSKGFCRLRLGSVSPVESQLSFPLSSVAVLFDSRSRVLEPGPVAGASPCRRLPEVSCGEHLPGCGPATPL